MRPLTSCACGKSGRFKRPGLCAWCHKAETRVYKPENAAKLAAWRARRKAAQT